MKKLSLDIEELAVESFDTEEVKRGSGTVYANAASNRLTCAYTCADTCGTPCYDTAAYTCEYDTCGCAYTYDQTQIDTNRSCIYICPVCA